MNIQVVVENFDIDGHPYRSKVKPIKSNSPIAGLMNDIISVINFKEDRETILPRYNKNNTPSLDMNKIKPFDSFMYQEKLDSPV